MDGYAASRVGPKGRVVIPARVRSAAGIREGQEVFVHLDADGRVVIETRQSIKQRIRAAAASTRRKGSAVDRLLADRRADRALERRRARPRRRA